MHEYVMFSSRDAFRNWLENHCMSSTGVWLLFGKPGGLKTVKASEALEEALCFGWIDGQIQSLDDISYIKYFSERTKNSNWSEKNKKLADALEAQGMMTDSGRAKIAQAKKNGQWEKAKPPVITEEQVEQLSALLQGREPARTNFFAMPPSVKKTYTRGYFDAKTEAGREKRLSWIVERLNRNLKPM